MVDNSVLNIDGKNYDVVDTILVENIKYVYLVNQEDNKDFFVRREVTRDESRYLQPLVSEEELKKALELFYEKNK